MMQQDFQATHWQALTALWRQQQLTDVHIRASCGEVLAAHSIVLASASGFFRALLCGAGRSMREGCTAANSHHQTQHQQHATSTSCMAGCNAAGLNAQLVVDLPYSGQQLSALLGILYEHNLEVCAHSVSWLLDMAAYLEVQPLQDACCEFLRSALSSDACVDVLLLAHHYQCNQLQAEAVDYLAKRMSTLLVLPDSRQALMRLPEPLLRQLLACEAVDVEQESELLCFVSDWVCQRPAERHPHLPHLLPLLKLSALPEEQLSQQQLQACSSGLPAVQLAQQLYRAAQACHHAQPHWQTQQQQWQQQQPQVQQQQQQQWQQQQPQVQQQQVSRRQAGPPVADLSVAGQRLAGCRAGSPEAPDLLDTSIAPVSSSSGSGSNGSNGSSGSSSNPWWGEGRVSLDANNNSSGDGSGSSSREGLLACSNNAVPGVSGSNAGSNCMQGVCGVTGGWCGVERIGAVVAQAWPGRQRGYQPTSILVAGGHDPSWRGLKAVELYDPVQDVWKSGPMLPSALPFAGAGVPTRGQVYIIGGAMCSNYMARLDVVNEEWHNCEGPRLSRLHAGVTGTGGVVYVTGGRTQVNVVVSAVEAYDHASSTWQSLPDMLQPRYAHTAVAQGGCLYSLGGQASKAIHRTVEVFDPQRGSWQVLGAQLHSERKYCAAASLGGRLLVLGGMNEARRRLCSVEAYDPREGRWTELTSMQHARSSCSVACVGGKLYVMGGSTGNEQLHGSEPCTMVERYDPLTGQWSSSTPLSCARTGLAAVSI